MQTPEETIRQAMSILGSRTSPKKARASRINGRKPKKKHHKSKTNANRSEISALPENKVEEKS